MSLSNYVPRGFPAAAIEHIKKHGPAMTGPLADAIGCDQGSLPTILQTAIAHGVLKKEFTIHMGRRVNQYSLGDGVRIRLADDEPATAADAATGQPAHASEPVCSRSHPHELMSPACEELAERARTDAAARAAGAAEIEPPLAEAAPNDRPVANLAKELADVVDAEFVEVAISNTGRLLISNGVQQMALSPAQTEKVFEYLDAHRGIEWEGA